jgi:hypothetical protein
MQGVLPNLGCANLELQRLIFIAASDWGNYTHGISRQVVLQQRVLQLLEFLFAGFQCKIQCALVV